jgi:pantetheine-phosphate adenylyltransferase
MTPSPRIGVCAGSFDPMTNGHLDLITRAAGLFDRVVVAILANPSKRPWFPLADRVAMARGVVQNVLGAANIEIDTFDGLLADYVRKIGAAAVVRGLRTAAEFEDEAQMAAMNRHLYPGSDTVFLAASPAVAFISSRLVKEIASLGGPVDGLVPPIVAARLTRRASPGIPV